MLFLAVWRPQTSHFWFRCVLPALYGGHDWALVELPTAARRGLRVKMSSPSIYRGADLDSYDVIVLAASIQADGWEEWIRDRRAAGVRVLAEVDDYLHGCLTHPGFDPKVRAFWADAGLARFERRMAAADGVLASTAYAAERYRDFNPRTFVCRNGLDTDNWQPASTPEDGVVIGWAGSYLEHSQSVPPWLPAVANVMERHDEVRFLVFGTPEFAEGLRDRFGEYRCQGFGPVELPDYAAAVSQMDVALAPAAHTEMLRGKPAQRWLTAAALGRPVVADPWIYSGVRDGETGLLAVTAEECEHALERLVTNPELRREIGAGARRAVQGERDMEAAVKQWHRAFEAVLEPRDAGWGWRVDRAGGAREARALLGRFWRESTDPQLLRCFTPHGEIERWRATAPVSA